MEVEIAWSITVTSEKVLVGDHSGSAQGIDKKYVGYGGVVSWGWALEIRGGLVLVPSSEKEGLEPQAREVHPLKAPVVQEWGPLLPVVATTTKYAYGIFAGLAVHRPLPRPFIPRDLVLEVVSALHVVQGQIVAAMVMATFLSGNSTNTLQQSRHSLGTLTSLEC